MGWEDAHRSCEHARFVESGGGGADLDKARTHARSAHWLVVLLRGATTHDFMRQIHQYITAALWNADTRVDTGVAHPGRRVARQRMG
jgi:hypothetical protein